MNDATGEPTWPLDDPSSAGVPDPWKVDPEPSTFIAFWQDDAAPTREEILHALSEACDGFAVLEDELPGAPEHIRWNVVVRGPEPLPAFIVWCEAAQSAHDPPEEFAAIKSCPFILGFETMLPSNAPIEGYAAALRWLLDALDPVPILLDANLGTYMLRDRLVDLLGRENDDVPGDLLWVVQIEGREGESGPRWLYTTGLQRCGRPELEMLDVPGELSTIASIMLNGLGEISLESDLPPPGHVFEIGAGLPVALQSWDVAAAHIEQGDLGSRADRDARGEGRFTGMRAAVCAEKPRGVYRPAWVCPVEVMQKLAKDQATLFASSRSTRQHERLARRTWPELAMAFAALHRGREVDAPREDIVFLLKSGFVDASHTDRGREHLWFHVERFEGDRAECVLLNQPVFITELKQGDRRWIERSQLSDWLVRTESRDIVPAMAAALRTLGDESTAQNKSESS